MKRSNKLVEYNGIVAYNVFVHLYIYIYDIVDLYTYTHIIWFDQYNRINFIVVFKT